jgi:hypothetical protein
MSSKSRDDKVRGVATRSKKGLIPRQKGKALDNRKAGGVSSANAGEIARRTTPASKARSR